MANQVSVRFDIRFDHPIKFWVIQLGGWMPISLSGAKVILLDRCVRSNLVDLSSRPVRADKEAHAYWLSHLDKPGLQINPALCAFEGVKRRVPTFEEFVSELESSTNILKGLLKQAKLIEHDPKDYEQIYENVSSLGARYSQEAKFLMAVCPLISHRVGKGKEVRVEAKISEIAHTLGLEKSSIFLISALSCLYELPSGKSPHIGRSVLNPTPSYTPEQAHNAISDIRSLEFLAAISGLPGASIGLCTGDQHLAALWVALRVSNPRWVGKKFMAIVSPSKRLFPRLDDGGFSALASRFNWADA